MRTICYNISVEALHKKCYMLILATLAAVFLAVGCSSAAGITLLRSDITLTVGERRDILPYIGTSGVSRDEIELLSDSDCIRIEGTAVVAVAAGEAKLTVRVADIGATMTVAVVPRALSDFSVSVENGIQTTDGDPTAVVMTVVAEGNADAQANAMWHIGDISHTGADFLYTPPTYGEYTVDVTVGEIKKNCYIKVYRRTQVEVSHSDLGEVKAFLPLKFTAKERVNTLNPPSVYEWRVNGETACSDSSFTFVPAIGKYKISLYVNGECTAIDGKSEIELSAVDNSEDIKIEFADVDGVYVRWSSRRNVLYVSVTSPNGKRKIFDVTDAQYSHLFGDGTFKATEYIDIFTPDGGEYNITIGTDVGKYELMFGGISDNAKAYLESVALCDNAYITDAEKARRFVWQLYAIGQTQAQCYAAGEVSAVVKAIADQAEFFGLNVSIAQNGNELALSFEPYANAPEKYETKAVNSTYTVIPHIEYNVTKRRQSDHVFLSDRRAQSVRVRTTEQLLYAVCNGYKPIVQSGDAAFAVYNAAKTVLLRIIGSEYTPREKVHAIYDWLQWVTVNTDTKTGSSACSFLEGVFTAPKAAGSGYAVTSEGAAKAFGLLCGIEGITSALCRDDGGFYNKVELNGIWYNVDVYGGKITGGELGSTELMSHRGLLISDSMLKDLGHGPDGQCEAYDISESEFLQKRTYDGVYYDRYVDGAEADSYSVIRAAVFDAFDGITRESFRIPYVGSEVLFPQNIYGIEFALDPSLTEKQIEKVVALINKAVDEYAKNVLNATFIKKSTIVCDGIAAVIAQSPQTEAK